MTVSRHPLGAAVVAALLLVLGAGTAVLLPVAHATVLAPHAPISVVGNAGFNATNGVVGGTGTAADPYIIAGWFVDAPPSMGVQIRGTDAHVVVRDVLVTGAPTAGFYTFDVSNLTFSNVTSYGSAGDGLRIESSHDIVLQACNATANDDGITVLSSSHVSLVRNNVSLSRGDGVAVSLSNAILVQANAISAAGLYGGFGLDLAGSTNVTVLANRFTGNDIYLDGTTAAQFTSHTITPDNLASGLPILYLSSRTGVGLSGIGIGELLLAGCQHLNVSALTTQGGDVGVEVAFSSDVQLGPDLTVSQAALGLRVVDSSVVRFVRGAILDTGIGASLERSTDVAVTESKVSAPFALSATPGDAVAIIGSDRVNVSGNVLRRHINGVSSSGSGNVTLVGNTLSLNAIGITLEGSRDLLVTDNLLSQDAAGLQVHGVGNATFARNGFEGAALGVNASDSSGLRFVHNAFLNDGQNAFDANGSLDAWDGGYPSGGNFWSNYTGVDRCSGALQNTCTGPDGIGDTPYVFEANATDRYPLMRSPISADVPPEALFYLVPSAGTVITTFSASANLSSDYEDPLGALQVRWDWYGNGSWTPWSAAKFSSHRYTVPGTYTLTLEVRDTANLTDTWSTQILVVPKPDNLPPTITIVAPSSVDIGQPITIVANITDASGVASAAVYYFGVDGGSFVAITMNHELNGPNFTATIPGQPQAGSLIFAVVANDTWENQARAPLGGYITVTIVDPVAAFLSTLVVPLAVVGVAAVAFAVWYWNRHRRGRTGAPPASPPESPPSEGPPDNP